MASQRLINGLNRVFTGRTLDGDNWIPNNLVPTNKLFSNFLIIDIKETIEVPAFLKVVMASYLDLVKSQRLRLERAGKLEEFKKPDSLVVALYSDDIPVLKKTGDSIITYTLETTLQQKLRCFITPADETSKFYGARGLLLDKDKNVMMLASVKFNVAENYAYTVTDQTLSINPSVFVNKDLVSKTIVGKVLPTLIESNLTFKEIKFLIEDKSKLIQAPKPPSSYNISDELNQVLLENFDYLSSDYQTEVNGELF